MNCISDRILIVACALLLIALAAAPAASAVTVYPGSEVTLTGTSTGSDTVYLFVTGPNLPPAGGRLDSPHTAVRSGDPGSFTGVTVGSDDRWTYRWRTGEARLDAGTYTVYAVDAPVDRRNLAGHSYTTLPVTLAVPPVTSVADIAVPPLPPEETETPTTMPTATPTPEPTTAAPPLAALVTVGAAFAAAILFLRR